MNKDKVNTGYYSSQSENPEGWFTKKMEELTLKTKQKNPQKNPDHRFKYVDISSISRATLKIETTTDYKGQDAPSRARKQIKKDDILFSTVRPYLKQVAMVGEELDGQVCSTGFCVIRCNPDFADPMYISQHVTMDSFIQKVSILQTGSNYPAITDKDIFSQSILCPPLPEQQKIAEILSSVDEIIEKTEAIIAQTEILKQGLLQEIFKKNWPTKRLGDYFSLLTGQYYPYSDFDNHGIKCLKIDNVGYGKIIWDTTTFLPVTYLEKYYDLILKEKDIVIALNRPITNGKLKVAMLREQDAPALLYQRVGKFVTKKEGYEKQFMFAYLNSECFKKMISKSLMGSDQPYIRNSSLLNLKIPLPPLSEQQKITSILFSMDEKLESERKQLEQLKTLKKGLMQDLLTGKVRVEVGPNA